MSENHETVQVMRVIEVGVCPLCDEALHGEVISEIAVPHEKIDTKKHKVQMEMEPVSFELMAHGCYKESKPQFRTRHRANNTRIEGRSIYRRVSPDQIASNRFASNEF